MTWGIISGLIVVSLLLIAVATVNAFLLVRLTGGLSNLSEVMSKLRAADGERADLWDQLDHFRKRDARRQRKTKDQPEEGLSNDPVTARQQVAAAWNKSAV